MMNTINNKYLLWYHKIIDRAKCRVLPKEAYTENHHIIPRSLGGLNSPDNLVALTAREHFIVHMLLPRFLKGKAKAKMIYAIWGFTIMNKCKINARLYEHIKSQLKHSQLTKNKISAKAKGRPSKKFGTGKMYEFHNPRYGVIKNTIYSLMRMFSNIKLDASALHSVATGKKTQYKGWTVPGVNWVGKTASERRGCGNYKKLNVKIHKFYHPVYGIHISSIIDLVRKFPELKLNTGALHNKTKGIGKQHKGWVVINNSNETKYCVNNNFVDINT